MVPKLRNLLGAFLFRGDDVDKRVKVLSGGEKSRLALAKMLLRPANLLLMDEPTNHLDLDSKEVLLEALKQYAGTIVIVSHDRYFIDELASRVAEVGSGKVHLYWGNYEDYLRAKQAEVDRQQEKESATPLRGRTEPEAAEPRRHRKSAGPTAATSKDRTGKRKRLDDVEETIADLETAVSSLEGRMAVPGFYEDREAAEEVVASHRGLRERLAALYQEWEELAAAAVPESRVKSR
jgi:ATP-binding cassette subfamily F protein 3